MSWKYYTKLREKNPFTVEIIRIENGELKELLFVFDDAIVAQTLPDNLGNYYSWMAIQVKKYIKSEYKLTGLVKCIFYSNYETNKKCHASIVIDCDSNKDLDAFLYQ